MGLDQYFFTSSEDCGHLSSFIVDREELHYWRKHADLNQFMLNFMKIYAMVIAIKDDKEMKAKALKNTSPETLKVLKDLWEEYQDEERMTIATKIVVQDASNSKYMKINPALLDILEELVVSQSLPKGSGFFWGESEYSDEDIAYDLEAIKKARQAMEEGKYVYYYPNW